MVVIALPTVDVPSAEAFVAGICTIAVFAVPLLVNVYKTAHDALAQVREVKPRVAENTKRLKEHEAMLNGELDERISSQIQAIVDANGVGAGNDAPPRAMSTSGEESNLTSNSG